MRSGPLRQRIAIDEPVTDQSASGEETVVWTERLVIPASIEPLNGRERLREQEAVTADIDVRIRVRWIPLLDEMTAKWRVRHVEKGTIYNVSAPPSNIDMRNREVEILANTGLNQG